MDQPPPPPPPPPHGHDAGGGGSSGPNGSNNRSGLPPGNYDIFVIPPHSAGSGFLYLPSLQPHRNSFLAGAASALLAVAVWTIVLPVLREWLSTIMASGGTGVLFLMVGMAVAGWAWGKTQVEGGGFTPGGGGAGGGPHAFKAGPAPGAGPPPQYPHANGAPPHPGAGFEPPPRPKPTWTRSTPGPGAGAGAGAPKTSWEKAREETRKKEEERKRAEELRQKREAEEKERARQRERDARERREREAKETKEREERERREREAREARERERARGSRPASPSKPRHQATARTELGDEDDAYSFRPYDKPKKPGPRAATAHTATASSVYSESYAPSQSTARTTPPPSQRGPYRTKDEDKIVIKAVYAFNNAFHNRPVAQLVSGVGPVTDGLILRISTEGLFIDDDVRGVPQREWDVKAWTLKLIEVCPPRAIFLPLALVLMLTVRRPPSSAASMSCAPRSATRRASATSSCSRMTRPGRPRRGSRSCGKVRKCVPSASAGYP